MDFVFIAPIYNLQIKTDIDTSLNFCDLYMSNTKRFLNETILKADFKEVLGNYLVYDFYDDRDPDNPIVNTYVYLKGSITNITTEQDLLKKQSQTGFATRLTNILLLEVQNYINKLWLLKDNSVYIRDGFVAMKLPNNRNRIFKYSLRDIYYDLACKREEIVFTKHELKQAFNYVKDSDRTAFQIKEISPEEIMSLYEKYIDLNLFSKKNKLITDNIKKSEYFIKMSRSEFHTDVKIYFYISALEALFMSDSKGELTHQISEKVAHLLGENTDEKLDYYKNMKKAYNIRSAVAHGGTYKHSNEELLEYVEFLDNVLRNIWLNKLEIFEKTQSEINKYFEEICFS